MSARHGERALLNLGHTFGHALEAAAGFSGRLLHGEAISLGIALAFGFSAERGLLPQRRPSGSSATFAAVGLPIDFRRFPEVRPARRA